MTSLKLFSKPPTPEDAPVESIIQPGRRTIGPELAKRILDGANYERQRKVRSDALRRAITLVKSDAFVDGLQIWFARCQGRVYLIDGQHRLSGVWLSGVERVFDVQVIDCADLDDVHSHYIRFDRFGRRRSDAEVLSSIDLAHELGLEKRMAIAAWKATAFIADDFPQKLSMATSKLPTDESKADFVHAMSSEVAAFAEALDYADTELKRGLQLPSVVAVGLLTFRDQPAKAKEFWEGVAMDDGLRRGDPRHTLVKALRARQVRGGHLGGARVAATAWNAFYEGRQLTLIKVLSAEVRIAGVKRPK